MENLRTIAEIAITIASFSALIPLFRQNKLKWEFEDKVNLIRFYSMLEISVILIVCCYLPQIVAKISSLGDHVKSTISTPIRKNTNISSGNMAAKSPVIETSCWYRSTD